MTVSETTLERAMRAAYSATPHNRPYDQLVGPQFTKLKAEIRAALTAALSDQVVVPKEPTDAQIISALEWSLEWMRAHKVDGLSPFKDYPPVKDTIKGMYAAMIAVAPPPSSTAGESKSE